MLSNGLDIDLVVGHCVICLGVLKIKTLTILNVENVEVDKTIHATCECSIHNVKNFKFLSRGKALYMKRKRKINKICQNE